jgi:hypothetical protein
MELDLPTPVSCPPSRRLHLHSFVAYPPPKVIAKYDNIFYGLGKFLWPNPLDVKVSLPNIYQLKVQKK